MPSRAGTQSAANSDIDTEQSNANAAASETRKRKAPAASSRANSAKKATPANRRSSKAGKNVTAAAKDDTPPQAERDESLDADDDDDQEDDEHEKPSNGHASGQTRTRGTNRKAQNRNAQRESRQRKAEYVKALEGLVALQKVDMSAQLQGLLFAIGYLIDENRKLRATLGQISTLFADPTQGSRLPDIGVDIHKLKEAVERNDKLYLLDLGDLLRERVGQQSKASQAEKQPTGNSDQSKEDGATASKPGGNVQTYPDPSKHEPIFGSLTARAEKELLDKVQETGQSFETGLGTLTAPHSPLKASNAAHSQARNGDTGDADASGQPKTTQIEELFRIFQHTTQMEQAAGSSASAEQPRAGSSHSAQGNNSSTGTPNDFSEYLQTNLLQNNHDNSGALDFNHFLFANGPSPPGFQMPDFSSFGLNMPQYSSSATPYPTSNINDTTNAFLHPQIPSLAPSPAFGSAAGDIGSFLKDSPLSGYAASTTLSNLTSGPAISPAVLPSAQMASLRETSKTLHKQATQLIKFHLRSKQEDATHDLPIALQPTAAQSMMPHDQRIDAVLWPSMRDRLIFSGGKVDLAVILQLLESGEAVFVHATGDLLDPEAWELSETFVQAHPALMDGELLKVCNKWRSARGDPQITL